MATQTSSIDEILSRGVAEVIERPHLELRLRRSRPLRIKYGIDPTGFEIHLGHAVPLRKLREFQAAGHLAVIIIGDATAQIGDPSGRDKTRVPLTHSQVRRHAETYLEQLARILDMKRTEVHYNSEWFDKFDLTKTLTLLSRATFQQLMAHETFRQRVDRGQALGFHELTYPLLQGYDSVAVEADVELGGLDQKFNLLMGRTMQAAYDQAPQDILLTPYLVGLDGKIKMSKTAKNYVAISAPANEMFGQIMSIPDKAIPTYFELATNLPVADIDEIRRSLKSKKANARDVKVRLALAVVGLYHGTDAAEQASLEFTKVFRDKKSPSTMPSISLRSGQHPIMNVLVGHQLVSSRSEARRLIEQGGVKYNQQPITDWDANITAAEGAVLQLGKRKFIRLTLSA